MKLFSYILALGGILLVIFCTISEYTNQSVINVGFTSVSVLFGMSLAIFLMLLAVLIKVRSRKEDLSTRDTLTTLCVIGIIALVGVYSIFWYKGPSDQWVIDRFHEIYYESFTSDWTYFLGVPTIQYPNDNWVMQEIITEVKPDFIIETGTFTGGATLFYATILEKVNKKGKIITMDPYPKIEQASNFKLWKEKVEFIKESSVSPKVIAQLTKRTKNHKVLVTLDALHTKEYVLKELELYAPLVSVNSYLIVQDTHLNGHPIDPDHGEGPWEAVEVFLKNNKHYKIDHSKERHLISQYPSGILKRIN